MDTKWGRLLLSTLLIVCTIYNTVGQNYNDDSTDFDEFDYPSRDSYTDNLQKRLSKFVRIGRGLSSFIRIGRQTPFNELDFYQSEDIPNAIDNDNGDNVDSAFFPAEPDTIDRPTKRLSSFVRIGRNYNGENELTENDFSKRGGAFIRMGKFPSSAFLRNRPGSVNRYTTQPYYRRTGRIGHSSFIRIGKRDTTDALRRMSENENNHGTEALIQQNQNTQNDIGNEVEHNTDDRRYLKIGRDTENQYDEKDEDDSDERRYLKIGREVENTSHDHNKEILDNAIEELGRQNNHGEPSSQVESSSNDQDGTSEPLNDLDGHAEGSLISEFQYSWPHTFQQKRLSNFAGLGKDSDDINKRFSSFVRIGKSGNLADDITKRRLSSFVRIGKKSTQTDPIDAQRANALLQSLENADFNAGNPNKRFSSFVRIGKSPEQLENDIKKRYSSFVRIGKSGDNLGNDMAKRFSSFVRIGRNYPQVENEYNKRLSSFIRVGKSDQESSNTFNKRYSSFVRIGKDSPSLLGQPEKRYSSFVRIGKSSNNFEPTYNKRLSSFIRVGKEPTSVNSVNDDTLSDKIDSEKD